jgi:hypothetical protein
VKVEEGISFGTNEASNQMMQTGWSLEGEPSNDLSSYGNVQLVQSVFT